MQQLFLFAATPFLTFWLAFAYTAARERYFDWCRLRRLPDGQSPDRLRTRNPQVLETWPALFLESAVLVLISSLSIVSVVTTTDASRVEETTRETAFWGLVSIPPLMGALVTGLTRREERIIQDYTKPLEPGTAKRLQKHRLKCTIFSYVVACACMLYGDYAVGVVVEASTRV